jgi:membrane protein DedA with SNARE-associated domain
VGRGRWTFERFVAAVQAIAGLAVVAMFVTLGLSGSGPDRTAFDRGFPFVVAAFALVVTVWVVARGLRRARRARRAARDA